MSDQPQSAPQQPKPPAQPQTVVNVNLANTNTATAQADAAAVAVAAPGPKPSAPPAPKIKSILAAYLCLAVTGLAGWHRFYLRRPTIVWLGGLHVQTALAIGTGNPLFFWGVAAMLAADIIEIPGWVRQCNKTTVAARADAKAKKEEATDTRTLLLQEAHRGDGKLTVTQGVLATGLEWDRVEGCVRDMVHAGYVDVGNEPHSGVIVYVFPELVGRPKPIAPGPAASEPELTHERSER